MAKDNDDSEREEMIRTQEAIYENGTVRKIALAGFGKNMSRYGEFGRDIMQDVYKSALDQDPVAYEVLFKGNASVQASLEANAQKFWGSAISNLPVEYLLKEIELPDKYKGKLVSELDEEVQEKVVSGVIQSEIIGVLQEGMDEEKAKISRHLESILKPEDSSSE